MITKNDFDSPVKLTLYLQTTMNCKYTRLWISPTYKMNKLEESPQCIAQN